MSELFKVVDNIIYKKQYDEDLNAYNPFIVNKALSMNVDTTWYANDMNMAHYLSHRMQYDYLFYSIKATKRYNRWVKASQNDQQDLELIQKYFKYNRQKAKQALRLLTKDNLDQIRKRMNTGGNDK